MSIYEKLRTLLGDAMVKYSFIFKDSSSSYDNGYGEIFFRNILLLSVLWV